MRPKSYLFLFLLLLVLIFILGVRYGQKVEKTNKAIDYVLRITPTAPISPTPLLYATSESKIWKIKFSYPSNLKMKEDASKSAIIFAP